jgi:hypothetical protein
VSILRQRQAFAADGAMGGSGRTGDVWRRPAMPGTPGSPVDHLQAHGTASGRGCRDGRSGSRALDKTFQPLVITRTVTVTNLSQASLGRPSPRALKPRLRYKLNHGVVGGVYYNLYTRGARPGRVVCLRCSCEHVGWALARLAPPSGRAASRAWSRVARRVGGR